MSNMALMAAESVASAPTHVRVFTAPMEELPKALDDMDDDEEGEQPEGEAGEEQGSAERGAEGEGGAEDDTASEGGLGGGSDAEADADARGLGYGSGGAAGGGGGSESDGDVELLEVRAHRGEGRDPRRRWRRGECRMQGRGGNCQGVTGWLPCRRPAFGLLLTVCTSAAPQDEPFAAGAADAGPCHVSGKTATGAAAGGAAAAAVEAATAAAAAVAACGKAPCALCSAVISRHMLYCATCASPFHLDCMAARWAATAVPAAADAAVAWSAGGGGGGSRFGGVPEQGSCPACGAAHTWMELLRGMQTVGWGNKSGRRQR